MTSKTFIILTIAFLYLLFSAGVLGLVVFKVHAEGKALEERVGLIAERNAKVKMFSALTRLVEETKEERAELISYVLTEKETSAFLTEIEALGAQMGTVLSTVSLKVVEKGSDHDELQIEYSVEGNEQSVKEMLRIFETLPYHSAVNGVTFTREPGGGFKGTVKLTVSILSYDQ